MDIKRLVMGYVSTNTYFVSKGDTMIVVDPCLGINADESELIKAIEGYNVVAILITHAHFDHISGIDAIANKTGCPVYVYQSEVDYLQDPQLNLSTMIPEKVVVKTPAIAIEVGRLELDEHFDFEVISTPGHTAGSISYKINNIVFDGDFIFDGTVGRMDLPTGSQDDMVHALHRFIERYNNKDIILYPGHGPSTTLANFIQTYYNPQILGR